MTIKAIKKLNAEIERLQEDLNRMEDRFELSNPSVFSISSLQTKQIKIALLAEYQADAEYLKTTLSNDNLKELALDAMKQTFRRFQEVSSRALDKSSCHAFEMTTLFEIYKAKYVFYKQFLPSEILDSIKLLGLNNIS